MLVILPCTLLREGVWMNLQREAAMCKFSVLA